MADCKHIRINLFLYDHYCIVNDLKANELTILFIKAEPND